MDNLNLVVEEYDNLKSEYDKIIRKVDINQLELLSFDDFLKN
jgi:predicted thioredoxin/glutaredoxin